MLRRAMRPRTVVLDPDLLRGHHPDHFQLVNAPPPRRRASEAGCRGLAGCVRERRGDLLIEADFTGAADFTLSAGRFARTDYRIEVVALAGPTAGSRQPAADPRQLRPRPGARRRHRAPRPGRARQGLPGVGRHRGGRGRRPRRQRGPGDRRRPPGPGPGPVVRLGPGRCPAPPLHRRRGRPLPLRPAGAAPSAAPPAGGGRRRRRPGVHHRARRNRRCPPSHHPGQLQAPAGCPQSPCSARAG